MAKMTEADATQLLVAAATLAAQLAGLIPTLVSNFQAIKEGLRTNDTDVLHDKIVTAHQEIQALDAQIQALRR